MIGMMGMDLREWNFWWKKQDYVLRTIDCRIDQTDVEKGYDEKKRYQ